MNFDPSDSAAWRTFGMLDPDESAIFDEAMRHDPGLKTAYREMDSLAAAIAAVSVAPVPSAADQLERLHERLKLRHAATRPRSWQAATGWATAAVLALMLVLVWTGLVGNRRATTGDSRTDLSAQPKSAAVPAAPLVETHRLNQEIDELRENLERFQQRDRALFVTVPGKAWPIVISMAPPGVTVEEIPSLARTDAPSPLTTMLGDALAATAPVSSGETATEADAEAETWEETAALPEFSTAVSIYDAARDAGTLVVRQLPPAEAGNSYNLWVVTTAGGRPTFVGSLPESGAPESDSFDFSLGSTMILPLGFVLTQDPQGSPAPPHRSQHHPARPASRRTLNLRDCQDRVGPRNLFETPAPCGNF